MRRRPDEIWHLRESCDLGPRLCPHRQHGEKAPHLLEQMRGLNEVLRVKEPCKLLKCYTDIRGCGPSTSVRLKVAETEVARDRCRAAPEVIRPLPPCLPQGRAPPSQPWLPGGRGLIGRESSGEGEHRAGARSTEWEGPQLGSVAHWHYWCWADGSSGFQFSFSTETWAQRMSPCNWHLDAGGRARARSLDMLGPGPGLTGDLLGDLVSHFPIATLSSVLRKMGTLFPTLPTSQIKRETGVPRALKRIMGRQGVIMALVSNPLNSLKTREGARDRKELGCLQPLSGEPGLRGCQGREGRWREGRQNSPGL
ncbi:uncharacterized protein LOC111153239 [Enhydra lutris kenyoni]|uniref:Uncharacterized protein LOC111153239 n=1 Tax=Enhydra lutris kenyoni TaxID=391180 RepID=A0A2Y9K3M7_ENHLU|nr:uncharacterized protein LOC111153239 [Enhydra lutris kenyoni]